jgi:hypothetical protein
MMSRAFSQLPRALVHSNDKVLASSDCSECGQCYQPQQQGQNQGCPIGLVPANFGPGSAATVLAQSSDLQAGV